MAVTKRTRYEVLKRDNHTCRYCGASAPNATLTVDHVTPVALGGSDAPDNLVAACRDCNAGKASTAPSDPLVEDVKQDAVRWAAAMKLAAERRAAVTSAMAEYGMAFERDLREYGWPKDNWQIVMPDGWADSVEKFYSAGLPIQELRRGLAIAMSRSKVGRYEKFRYMCGICWSVLSEMQEDAQRIASEDKA